MRIHDAQMQQMLETRRGLFLDAFVEHLITTLPAVAARAGGTAAGEASRTAIRKRASEQLRCALAYGIGESEDAARYILYAFLHGEDFVTRRAFLRHSLEKPEIPPKRKMSLISAYYD